MLLLLDNSVPYLPGDQIARGGPIALALAAETNQNAVIALPDGSTVTVPVISIPVPAGDGDVALFWGVDPTAPSAGAGLTYSDGNSVYASPAGVDALAGASRSPFATGRLSAYTPPAGTILKTWGGVPAAGRSYYTALERGGNVGGLYIENLPVTETHISLPAWFGPAAENLLWLVCARVIGAPLWHRGGPVLQGARYSDAKALTRLARGRIHAPVLSPAPRLSFRISGAVDAAWAWHETLELADAEERLVCLPTGLVAGYGETHPINFLQSGFMRRMALTAFSGATPVDGIAAGDNLSFSASFGEVA